MVTLNAQSNKSNRLGNQRLQTLKKKSAPFAYLTPTIVLMCILMVLPIVMVIGYSLMDNVVMNKNPVFIGLFQ